jgi:hypothetical protein
MVIITHNLLKRDMYIIKKSIRKIQIGLMLALILFSNNNTYASQEEEYHFRHTRWGMSQDEVKKAENGEPDPKRSKGSTLVWKAELLGENVLVAYTFAFNKLVRAKYMLLKYFSWSKTLYPSLTPKKPLAGECIVDFEKFEKALIEKYGKPEKQEARFSKEIDIVNDKRADIEDLEVMEDAIRNGKGFWASTWKTKDTQIVLILYGKSGEINFEIGYSSIKLVDLEKEAPL